MGSCARGLGATLSSGLAQAGCQAWRMTGACRLHGQRPWPHMHVGRAATCKYHATQPASDLCRRACSSSMACEPAGSSQAAEWPQLASWRAAGPDRRRGWSDGGPTAAVAAPGAADWESIPLAGTLSDVALQVLNTSSPAGKAALTHRAWLAYTSGQLPLDVASAAPPDRPARPARPQLVIPKLVPSPKDAPLPLAAYMLHNLAHIELNAIDLAWDTVARFSQLQLPASLYEDFARVADDESRHFGWCQQRLQELGFSYGDMVAHDLLWQGAQASAHDLNARLAIVPMSQEARGLDAGQRLVERLVGAGDPRTAAIVRQIALEEKAHVAVGVTWFQRVCTALGIDGRDVFRSLLTELGPDLLKGPFNHSARQEVGLPRDWYDVQQWPPQLQQAMVPPAKAAAARGKGQAVVAKGPTASSSCESAATGGSAGAAANVAAGAAMPEDQVQQVRHSDSVGAAEQRLSHKGAGSSSSSATDGWRHGEATDVKDELGSKPTAAPTGDVPLASDPEQLQQLRQRLLLLLGVEMAPSSTC